MQPIKQERLYEFLRRLEAAPAAPSFEAAYSLLCTLLNGVEDELTSIPYNTRNWQTDGRLYPPEMDNMRDVQGNNNVNRFRSLNHNTFIASNVAIEIQTISSSDVILSKAGADGRTVWGHTDT